MGFVGCALVMYVLWWDKPFDVQYPVPICCPPNDRERILKRLRDLFQMRNASRFTSPDWTVMLREQRIRNWSYLDESSLGLGKPMMWDCQTYIETYKDTEPGSQA